METRMSEDPDHLKLKELLEEAKSPWNSRCFLINRRCGCRKVRWPRRSSQFSQSILSITPKFAPLSAVFSLSRRAKR